MEYKDDLKIEPDALDIEWIRHPQKYMKWAEAAAEADRFLKAKKENLEIVDATIDKEIRENPGDRKVTEALIKSETALDQRHQKALQEYNTALYESNILAAAVKAFEQRKSALENLVRLWAGSYFSGPKESRDLKEKLDFNDKASRQARDTYLKNKQ